MLSSKNSDALDDLFRSLRERASVINGPSTVVVSAALIGLLFLLRMPSILLPHELNVDEGQMLSQGMKFLVDPVPWRAVDGTSGGPLNSYLISLLLLMRVRPGYFLVHVLASVLVVLQVLTAHRTLLRLGSERTAAWGVLPLALSLGLTSTFDFLHYSSELLPALLLALGFHGFVIWLEDVPAHPRSSRAFQLFLCGLTLGAVPWCKLQALPIAGALGLVVLVAVLSRKDLLHRATQVTMFCAGALLPACTILIVVAQTGTTRDFWYSYVLGNLAYAGPWNLDRTLLHFWLAVHTAEIWPLCLIGALGVALFTYKSFVKQNSGLSTFDRWVFGGVLVWTGAAFFAVLRPSTFFPHYTIFLLQPLAYLGAGLLSRAIPLPQIRYPLLQKSVAGLALGFAVAILWTYGATGVRYKGYAAAAMYEVSHPHPDSNQLIVAAIHAIEVTQPVRSLAIWGWTPGVYVLSGIPPATRDAIGHFVISPGPMQGYFRKRFLGDLVDKRPDLFIDSVSSGAFLWTSWTDRDGYESDADLKRFVDENYDLVGTLTLRVHTKPVRFFLRRATSATQ